MKEKFAFIGAGNMGGAVALAVCRGAGAANVLLFDPSTEKARALAKETGCLVAESAKEAVESADFAVFCVKPNIIAEVIRELLPVFKTLNEKGKRRVLVSIAAGVSISDIGAVLAEQGLELPIIRLLPNTPVAVGKGTTIMACSSAVTEGELELLEQAMAPGGEVIPIAEKMIDAATPVFSSSPAFTYMYIESLADGGVMAGVPRELAQRLAAQSVIGSAEMVLKSGKHPGQLKDEVCSPGGSTIVGVEELEKGGMRAAVASAVYEAYKKTTQLGKK